MNPRNPQQEFLRTVLGVLVLLAIVALFLGSPASAQEPACPAPTGPVTHTPASCAMGIAPERIVLIAVCGFTRVVVETGEDGETTVYTGGELRERFPELVGQKAIKIDLAGIEPDLDLLCTMGTKMGAPYTPGIKPPIPAEAYDTPASEPPPRPKAKPPEWSA